MHAEFHVAMSTGCDVEVALDFVALDRAVDAACVLVALQSRRLSEFPLSTVRGAQVVMHILVLAGAVRILIQCIPEPLSRIAIPLPPGCGIPLQHVGGENAITRRILNVNVYIGAAHGHHHIQVDLQLMRHALLDSEGMGDVASKVPSCL
jgi:hypothetical protein